MYRLSNISPSKLSFSIPKFHTYKSKPIQSFPATPIKISFNNTLTPQIPTQSSLIQETSPLFIKFATEQKEQKYKKMKEKVKEKIKKIISQKKFESDTNDVLKVKEKNKNKNNKTYKNRSINFLKNTYLDYINKDFQFSKPKEPQLILQNNFVGMGTEALKKSRVFDSPLMQSRVCSSHNRYSYTNTLDVHQLQKHKHTQHIRKSNTTHQDRKQRLKVSLEIETKLLGVGKHAKEPRRINTLFLNPKTKISHKSKLKIRNKKEIKTEEEFLERLEPWKNQIEDY